MLPCLVCAGGDAERSGGRMPATTFCAARARGVCFEFPPGMRNGYTGGGDVKAQRPEVLTTFVGQVIRNGKLKVRVEKQIGARMFILETGFLRQAGGRQRSCPIRRDHRAGRRDHRAAPRGRSISSR